MELYTHCSACKSDIRIKSDAKYRQVLHQEKGESFVVNCLTCRKTSKKNVNDVRAKPDKMFMLLGGVLGLVLSLLFFYVLGLIGLLGLTIPILFINQEKLAVNTFNSYLVRRK